MSLALRELLRRLAWRLLCKFGIVCCGQGPDECELLLERCFSGLNVEGDVEETAGDELGNKFEAVVKSITSSLEDSAPAGIFRGLSSFNV